MLKRVTLLVLFAMVLVPFSNATQNAIEGLGWIAGCWAMDDGKERTQENWMKTCGSIDDRDEQDCSRW